MVMKIYSYNNGDGSKLLADAMGIKRIKHNRSLYRPKHGDIVINWGCTALPDKYNVACVWNLSRAIQNVVNKRTFFELYQPHDEFKFNVPQAFFNREDAHAYMVQNPGTVIVARTVLSGHEGRGIILVDNPADLPVCHLYTVYVKKKAEYRVHVAFGKAIDVVQKKRRQGSEGDHRIRNTANGYVFARNNINVPDSVLSSAIDSVAFYSLDFGAVDIIWNEAQQKAYVLEINTAPGIEGTTVTKYAEAFLEQARL